MNGVISIDSNHQIQGVKVLWTLCLVALNWFFSQSVWANPLDFRFQPAFRVQSLSIKQGLSQSVVNQVIEDHQGFIWIATEDGLNRFNGYEFEIFEHGHGDPQSLHSNLIYSLLDDPLRGLWIGTQNGLSLMDKDSQRFTNYSLKNKALQTPIGELAKLGNRHLFIGSDNGLFVLDLKTHEVAKFTSSDGLAFDEPIVSLQVFEQSLWVATESCIYRVDFSGAKGAHLDSQVSDFCLSPLADLLQGKHLREIRLHQGRLWIATHQGLLVYQIDERKGQVFSREMPEGQRLIDNWVQSLAFDPVGNLWIGTASGVNFFNASTGLIEDFNQLSHPVEGLSSSDVMSLYVDSSGLIWVGTYAGGVNIVDPGQDGFRHTLTRSSLAPFKASNTIHAIVKDHQQGLWFANFGSGLFRLDLMTGQITKPLQNLTSATHGLKDDSYAYALMLDHQNRLWVGTSDGLILYDLTLDLTYELKIFKNGVRSSLDEYVFSIYQDRQANIWIATINGLYRVGAESKVTETLSVGAEPESPKQTRQMTTELQLYEMHQEFPFSYRERSQRVSTVYQTRDGNLWVGGQSGLLLYDSEAKSWQHFSYQLGNPLSLSNDEVQVIYEDSRGTLWIGTASGLNRVNREAGGVSFQRYTKQDGLPNNAIYGILEDQQHQIWLSTNAGLVAFHQDPMQLQIFREADGLSSDEFNTNGYFRDETGLLYFASINGLTLVDPHAITQIKRNRKLMVSKVLVDGERLQPKQSEPQAVPEIELEPDDLLLKISLTDLYFRQLGNMLYRYRLSPKSGNWSDLGGAREILLVDLAPGEYLLEVGSRLPREAWPEQSTKLAIKVKGDFWQSRIFVLILALVALTGLFLLLVIMRKGLQSQVKKLASQLAVEKVRVKNAKDDFLSLQQEFNQQKRSLNQIREDYAEAKALNQSQSFREPVTGLIRFQFLEKIVKSENLQGVQSRISCLALVKLTNRRQVEQTYGENCGAELFAHWSQLLQDETDAATQFYHWDDEHLLIHGTLPDTLPNALSDTATLASKKSHLVANLLSAQRKMTLSQIALANDISISSQFDLFYLDLGCHCLERREELLKLTQLLMDIYATIRQTGNVQNHYLSLTVTPQEMLETLLKSRGDWSLMMRLKLVELREQEQKIANDLGSNLKYDG